MFDFIVTGYSSLHAISSCKVSDIWANSKLHSSAVCRHIVPILITKSSLLTCKITADISKVQQKRAKNPATFILNILQKQFIAELKQTHLIYKIKELRYIIGNRWCVWISPFQMFFVYFAHAFHALVNRFIVGIGSCFRIDAWLYQQYCMCLQFYNISNALRFFRGADLPLWKFSGKTATFYGYAKLQTFEVRKITRHLAMSKTPQSFNIP